MSERIGCDRGGHVDIICHMQIIWILRSVGYEAGGASCANAVESLLSGCYNAAMAMLAGQGDMACCQCHPCTPSSNMFPITPMSFQTGNQAVSGSDDRQCQERHALRLHCEDSSLRLQELQNELGEGEGVSALVEASLLSLHAGGDGVVAQTFTSNSSVHEDMTSGSRRLNTFEATLNFFDRLCRCGQGLVKVPSDRRHSLLQQRLESCNKALYTHAMVSKVCHIL